MPVQAILEQIAYMHERLMHGDRALRSLCNHRAEKPVFVAPTIEAAVTIAHGSNGTEAAAMRMGSP